MMNREQQPHNDRRANGSRPGTCSPLEPVRDRQHLDAIRRFYLDPQQTYSLRELAAIWRVDLEDVRAIYHDDVVAWAEERPDAPDALPVQWIDALSASTAFNILTPHEVERALADDFDRVWPMSWRTVTVVVHLPRWLADAIAPGHPLIPLVPRRANLAMRVERALMDLFEDQRFEMFPVNNAHRSAVKP